MCTILPHIPFLLLCFSYPDHILVGGVFVVALSAYVMKYLTRFLHSWSCGGCGYKHNTGDTDFSSAKISIYL